MTAVIPVDQAARDRIRTTGLDDTLFVVAGAGTGKTHELVTRIVNLIASGQSMSELAAITFTEAAAAELRDRIRDTLEHEVAEPGIDAELCTRFEAALADLDTAPVGTLHGFCLRLLQEHPIDASLPPRVDVLDEVSSQLAFEQRWSTFVDNLYADPAAEAVVLRAWALGIEIETASRNSASFRDVAGTFDESWDRLEAVARTAPAPLTPISFAALAEPLASLRADMAGCTQPGVDLLHLECERICSEVEQVLDQDDPLRALGLALSRAPNWKSGRRGQQQNWPDVAAARAKANDLGAVGTALSRVVSDETLRHLTHRLARFTLDAAESRRRDGRLDFHDLLVLARRLLRTSGPARVGLRARYARLLLDEFQDTDPLQIDVAVLLASTVEGAEAAGPWQTVDTGRGQLFFVGDPKQSIYRFRRADIGLFLEARDRFGHDDPVVLSQNFRTVEPVLSWINTVFGGLMAQEVPGSQPAYEALAAARTPQTGADHRVVVLGGPSDAKAAPLRHEEAIAVAGTLAAIGADPAAWPVYDQQADVWREARWADITILVPTRTSLRQLEDALDSHHVPYRVATGSLAFDTQEVREVLDALRAIADPGDTLALVSALRSPLYACSDVDLVTFRQAGGRWDHRDPGSVAGDHPVVRAMAHLDTLSEDRWWREPSALLGRLLDERQAFALGFAGRRPREVWRRLRFIVDQARAFEEAGGGDSRAFVGWAERQQSEGARVHEPLMAETDDEAVSIMTIHGAKGLEFPITVVSGATTGFRNRRRGPQVFWDADIPEVRIGPKTTTEHFDRLADLESEMDEHERLRLLYVACTRARDHLIVSSFHNSRQRSYGQLLSQHAPEAARRPVPPPPPSALEPPTPPPLAPGTEDLTTPTDAWLDERNTVLAAAGAVRFRSATAVATDAPTTHEAVAEETAQGTAEADAPWRRGRAGTAIGRAVHAVLEHLDNPEDFDALRALAERYSAIEVVASEVETVMSLARSALTSPTVVASRAAPRRWKELYVAAPLGPVAVEGYVDLLYEGPDGLVIVDYKTDTVRNEAEIDAKVERYGLQLATYALALEACTGLTVSGGRLVFCTVGAAIERDIPDLESAKTRVREMLGAAP